ncbi:palmitoyltransferase ZDHHC19-like isoform X3 [Narcine bancroftii]|uniref:palmitoyltransferase ZDHHC19-like isoform X3 n=1 Tax=Narcine bancroftii TaxID=1343680 RepID=UPI003831635E
MDGKKWWRLALRRNLLACFTTCMILGSSGLFFTFPCAFLAVNVSLLLPIITGILFLSCFTSFIITSFMDPGILQQGSDISRHQNLDPQVVKVNGKVFYLKWCQVCQFYQPPRCSHCRLCNVCIEDFDHHCKWVNNCVGRRNYRFFFFFVFFLAIYMLTILGSCLMYLIINYNEPIMVEKSATYPFVLTGAGTGTYNKEEDRTNPFTRGWKRNFFIVLCGRIAPRYLGSLKKLETKRTSRKRDSQQASMETEKLKASKKAKKKEIISKMIQGHTLRVPSHHKAQR